MLYLPLNVLSWYRTYGGVLINTKISTLYSKNIGGKKSFVNLENYKDSQFFC